MFALLPASMALADGSCGDPFTPIYDIQGDGDESPLHFSFPDSQAVVTTEGIVTVDVQQRSEHSGFFLQDPNGDGDSSTSDGIFVFHRDTFGFDVSAGDYIRIEAEVDEFRGETQLERVSDVIVCGAGSVEPTVVKPRDFNAEPEQYEGMLVRFNGKLFVTDTFFTYRFGDVWLSDEAAVEQPTDVYPGDTPEVHALAADNMSKTVLLTSATTSRTTPPFLREGDTLRIGDRINALTGAVKFSFGNYRIINNPDPVFDAHNLRPAPPNVNGELTVASFNVLNYWTTLGGRGAETAEQLAIQQAKLVDAITMMDADVVGLQEMENDPSDGTVQTLVAALNAAEGADVWSYVDGFEQNIYPIVNEIIYRNDRVSPVGEALTLADPAFDAFRDPAMTPDDQLGRRPVAQAFEYEGKTFSVIVNHFKSKSSTGANDADEDQNDGQSAYNARRVLQAQAVLDWIPVVQEAYGDEDVLVIGDLNAYAREDPILLLETELHNLTERFVKDSYSFQFFASFAAPFIGRGALDHAFSTPEMNKQIQDVEYWHINADEPCWVRYYDPRSSCFDRGGLPDPGTLAPGPYGSSDHDPLLIGLRLKADDHPGQGKGNGR